MKSTALCSAIALLFASGSLLAGPMNYKCTVRQAHRFDAKGILVDEMPFKKAGAFMVDRVGGHIIGDWIPNAHASEIQVVNSGNDDWSFRVISYFGPPGQRPDRAEMLEIQEYIEGKSKPFIAIALAGILTGTCE